MPVNTMPSVAPREEIARLIMKGAHLNKTLIWDKVLPPLPLNQRTAHIPQLTIENADLLRVIDDETAPGADIQRMSSTVEDLTFTTAMRKKEIAIPFEAEEDYAKIYSQVAYWSTQLGKNTLGLTAEYLTKSALFNTTTFGAATNSAVAYTAANVATAKPIYDLLKALNAVYDGGEMPDAIVLDSRVMEYLSQCDTVKAWIIGALGPGADVNATTLERAFKSVGWEITVHVGRAIYNAGAKGVKSLSRIWTTDYIWVGRAGAVEDASDEGVPLLDGVGQTPFWENVGLMIGDNYIDFPKEQTVVRGKFTGKPQILNSSAGTLIATQWA